MASIIGSRHSRRTTAQLKQQVVRSKNIDDITARELRRNLSTLGFASYAQYQRSVTWKAIRKLVLERDANTCKCGEPATQVHHSQYDMLTLLGKNLTHLHSACASCHGRIHYLQQFGNDLDPSRATSKPKKKKAKKKKRRDNRRRS